MALMCSDCGFPAREMTKAALSKGSSVREPGEALCGGCSSRRVLMVLAVNKLPGSLSDIRAKRMSVA